MPSILALDQGTTGSTALVVHQDGRVLGRGSGRTKKVAEQEAAALASTAVRDLHEAPIATVEEEPEPEGDAESA